MKKPKLSTLKNKAWKLCSEYIRRKNSDQYGYCTCVTCHAKKPWGKMQGGHFIDGRRLAYLFDERGIFPQCYRCNICFHGAKVEYTLFMLRNFGPELVQELRALKYKKTVKFTVSQYLDLIEDYKLKLLHVDEEREKDSMRIGGILYNRKEGVVYTTYF